MHAATAARTCWDVPKHAGICPRKRTSQARTGLDDLDHLLVGLRNGQRPRRESSWSASGCQTLLVRLRVIACPSYVPGRPAANSSSATELVNEHFPKGEAPVLLCQRLRKCKTSIDSTGIAGPACAPKACNNFVAVSRESAYPVFYAQYDK